MLQERMKEMRKLFHRLGSAVLILSMLGTSVAMPECLFQKDITVQAEEAESSEELKISDKMQVKVDGAEEANLQLYSNGVYETKLELDAGTHTIQVMKNGATYKTEKNVTLDTAATVYVRVINGEVQDSVNNKDEFHTAALVGNFNGLDFVDKDGNPYTIVNWTPADANAELTYLGGGIFSRTFKFKALEKDLQLADGGYKVALDDGWDVSFGNGSGNIELTIPKGTEELTVFADILKGNVYDSVRSGSFKVTQNDPTADVKLNAFDYTVSAIGTVRCGVSDWDSKAKGFEFTKLTDSLYIYQATLAKGAYQYKTVMNYEYWYEANGGDNKSFTVTEDEQQVIFLYDAKEESLYDSVTSGDIIATRLGMQAEKAVSKVQDNANGTTTFITTMANEGDKVQLVYAPKANVTEQTTVTMKEGKNSKGNFDGTFVSDAIYFGDDALDYVFYYVINDKRTLDDAAEVVEVDSVSYSRYTRGKFTGRLITVPGTFPGKSWAETSNEMTYMGNGLYSYTFKDVPAANYEFKIATGSWAENYGVDGVPSGANYAVTVPEKQDVTIYYTDLTTHRAVTSLTYKFASAKVTGDGIDVTLEDPGLTGIYKATVAMKAGTYSNLVQSYEGENLPIDTIELKEDKEVTFYFDPSTGIYYNDSTMVETNKEAVKFDSKDTAYKSTFGAVEEGKNVTFSIDTGSDVTKALLVVKGHDLKTIDMKEAENGSNKKWSADVTFDKYGQYTYFFALYFGSYVQIYCDDDGFYGTGKVTNLSELRPYDLVVYKAGYKTPDWMKNSVIYQIFPDRFFNGDKSNDQAQTTSRGAVDYEYITKWYSYPENPSQEELHPDVYPEEACKGDGHWNNEIYGGDLKGIVDRIDYLKALGVNVIYLNPVFSSISSHRYDATDYMKIDPILGDLGDFSELVKVAEKNGMHIVLDGVFNHVSDDSIYFDRYYKFVGQDGKVGAYPYWAYVYDCMSEKGVTQEQAIAEAKTYFTGKGVTDFSYTEWFKVENKFMTDDKGVEVTDTIGDRAGKSVYTYEGWWGYDSMPVIMSTNGSEYQTGNWANEIIDGSGCVTQYWLSEGSNGWRLDVANEVSDETWQHFRQSVKGLDSDAVIIGEIWDDATEYILGDMYDSVMNYVFRNAVLDYAKGGSAKASVKTLEKIRERYPKEAFYAMMNLVGSHDTTRLLSFLDGINDDRQQTDIDSAFPTYEKTSLQAKQRQYLVALIQMTYPGAPTIYYGDEIGMVGADDPDNRRAMTWGKGNKELVEWYATLANIRSKYSALRTGDLTPVSLEDEALMSYVRNDADDTLVVVTNNSDKAKKLSYTLPEALKADGLVLEDLISGEKFTVEDGAVSITVPAYRGIILTSNAKALDVDLDGLKPAYDASFIVEDSETPDVPAPTSSAPVVEPSKKPVVSPTPTPSKKPVLKTQTISVPATYYTKEVGSKSFLLGAKAKGTLSYKTSDSSVVTVASNGRVTIKGVGKAYIKITAAQTKTYKAATKTVAVKVIPKKIGCSVKKKYSNKKYSMVVSWPKTKEVTGYKIEYATNAKFTGKKAVTVKSNKVSSITIPNMKKGKTYYVRIRTYKTVKGISYHSGYSNVRKIKM